MKIKKKSKDLNNHVSKLRVATSKQRNSHNINLKPT